MRAIESILDSQFIDAVRELEAVNYEIGFADKDRLGGGSKMVDRRESARTVLTEIVRAIYEYGSGIGKATPRGSVLLGADSVCHAQPHTMPVSVVVQKKSCDNVTENEASIGCDDSPRAAAHGGSAPNHDVHILHILDPDMHASALLLHMGEMTQQEMRTARAAIRWANSCFLKGK